MPYIFSAVVEAPGVEEYLIDRQLLKQYKKAKQYLLMGKYKTILFNRRNPKSSGIFYFRINDKYRAWGYIDGSTFVVSRIDDHQ